MNDLITQKKAMQLMGIGHPDTFKGLIAKYGLKPYPWGTGSRVRYSLTELKKKLNIKHE